SFENIVGGIQTGIIYQHIEIFNPIVDLLCDGLFNVRFQVAGDVHVFQPQPHILTADAAYRNGGGVCIGQTVQIYVPEPGNVGSVLAVIIDQDNNIRSEERRVGKESRSRERPHE